MPEDTLVTLIPIIIIGLIGLAAGGIIGYLLAGSANTSGDQSKRDRGLVETARFWRDRRTGQLILEIAGKTYTTVGQLGLKPRSQVERLFYDLQAWLGFTLPERREERLAAASAGLAAAGPAAGSSAPVGQALPTMAPTLKTPVRPPAPSQLPDQGIQPPLAATLKLTPPVLEEPAPEIRKPSLKLPDIIASAINPPKKEPVAPELSIAAQVDEIVQERLPASPFSERVVRLLEVPGKGMVVIVDQVQYESVNDVADEGVRQFLRDCVAEWEKRGVAPA